MSQDHLLPLSGRGRPRGPAKPKLRDANTVPAPQYDRMRAPVWTQTPAAPVRSGALDHQRIGSRGFRC